MITPVRVQLSRRAGWRKPENTIVVARPGRWGNPFRVGVHGTREECLEKYRCCVNSFPVAQENIRLWRDAGGDSRILIVLAGRVEEVLGELRGKHLACWCPLAAPCHADVLLEIAAGLDTPPRRCPT